ncbi:unnamed protein product [Adineta steineri]|uniref:Arrestin C-terminal-like domain-containing protein n=1 Tax=Adineta steineri TaxID=433720 RepID=A0A815S7U5_9BILA|nr:unnamed protein product [Adineta steineri]CAF3784095.1 unnamed protein product [Adineta steineri]
MGNITPSLLSSFKVKFNRETPYDFYLSGDRVHGVIVIVTNDKDNELNFRYGPLYVELIGESKDAIINNYQERIPNNAQIFFRKRAQVIKLPNDNQQLETSHRRTYKWVFDGLLDSSLPSSLPHHDDGDPYIGYYARVYLYRSNISRKVPFLVYTPTPIPFTIRQSLQNYAIERSIQHEDVTLRGILLNNGFIVPGQIHILQIEIHNPMKVTIKSIRAILKQYRNITDEETDFTIFSTVLTEFKPKGFNNSYHQDTYELLIPLEKCQVMTPTSSYKNVRYELHIQCSIHSLFNSHFTLTLPVICTSEHQRTLEIMDELKSLPEILQYLSIDEENLPPTYEDFVTSQPLPKYEDICH